MPGSGKSTIGRHLARRLQREFHDSDAVIEKRLGCSIRAYFEEAGESAFRAIESEVIDELSALPDCVLATGGGAVLNPLNRRRLHERCRVVYLRSLPSELYRRLKGDSQRPLLQTADPLARLNEMFAQRDPLYREAAHIVVDTGRPSVSALVRKVQAHLELEVPISGGEPPL
jgi:shikimate kinase